MARLKSGGAGNLYATLEISPFYLLQRRNDDRVKSLVVHHALSSSTMDPTSTKFDYLLNNQHGPRLNFSGKTTKELKKGQNEGVREYVVCSPLLICARNLAGTLAGAWRRDEPATLGSDASPPPVNA